MASELQESVEYTKRAARFLKKHPDMRLKYEKTLSALKDNPFHPGLRLHPLRGKLERLHAVSLDLQYRITLELVIIDQTVVLLNIGGHDEAYR